MSYEFHKASILIVEDNTAMIDILRALMTTFGIGKVIAARNGEEGFKKFCTHQPDLIIADWYMHPMDGLEMTRLIRSDPRSPNRFVPIIMMTGFSEMRRVLEARDTGITEFMVKPFKAKDLYRRVEQIIEKPRQFVQSDNFFGPDRRRRKDEYEGPKRRLQDLEAMTPEERKKEQLFAHETMRKNKDKKKARMTLSKDFVLSSGNNYKDG